MAEVRLLASDGPDAPMRPIDALPEAADERAWVWVDLRDPDSDTVEAAARAIGADIEVLGIVRGDAYPGARFGPSEVMLVTRSLTTVNERLSTTPLIMMLARGGLLTIRFDDIPGVDWARSRARQEASFAGRGAGTLLSHLVEIGAGRFAPLIEQLDASIEELEDRALDAHPSVLSDAHALRRDASLVRGVLRSQRDALRAVLRSTSPLMGDLTRRRLEDAYDVHQRIVESLETARVMLTGVIEVYRSAVAERTNDVMKVLTVFSAILLPLGLMAGIYGMNFEHMPELAYRNGYFVLLGAMAFVATGLWLYFARRGFIGGPKRATQVGRGLVHVAVIPVRTLATVTRVAGRVIPAAGRVIPGAGRVLPGKRPKDGGTGGDVPPVR